MKHSLMLLTLLSLAFAGLTTGCDKKKEDKPAATDKKKDGDKKKADDKKKAEGDKKKAEGDKKKAEGDKKKAEGDKKAEAKPADPVADTKKKIAVYMQNHYTDITLAKNALVQGNLDEFKVKMGQLAGRKVPEGAPEAWGPYAKKMTEAATAGKDVKDIPAAATALGNAATACANCHTNNADTSRIYATGKPPEAGNTMRSYMKRHVWAAKEMWAGIFGPDDAAWGNAVKVLKESPLTQAPGAKERWSKDAMKLAQDVDALAKLGAASKPEERPGVYGQFVATCASCHTALKVVPRGQ